MTEDVNLIAPIEVISETADFVVINKPVGVSVHKDQNEIGLLQVLAKQLNVQQLFLVHRLDKMTSGLLLLAKTTKANRELSLLFQNRQIEKFYIALSDRKPKKKQGLVMGDMEKARRGDWRLIKRTENPAITQFFSYGVEVKQPYNRMLRLFLMRPATGKTHQLRVMMKSVGAPILGDKRYYSGDTLWQNLDRGYLHAWQLMFEFQGIRYSFVAEPSQGDLFQLAAVKSQLASLNDNSVSWPRLKQQ